MKPTFEAAGYVWERQGRKPKWGEKFTCSNPDRSIPLAVPRWSNTMGRCGYDHEAVKRLGKVRAK